MVKNMKKDISLIVEEELVYPVFQPIVDLTNGQVAGYEALTRLKKTESIKDPETLFKMAGLYSKLWDVEHLCRKKILKQVSESEELLRDKKIFVNVNPMVMTDADFKQGFTKKYIEKHDINASQIVIEITEHSAVTDMKEFKSAVQHYKEQGYAIAVDDVGSCYSGINLICDVKPHYLKLDIEIIRDICKDAVKCAMVKSFVEFASLTGIKLIAEGIEKEEQLQLLMQLGVHYGQGFYLGRPEKEILPVSEKALKVIQTYHYRKLCERASYTGDYKVAIMKLGKTKALLAYEKKYGEEQCRELFNQLETGILDVLLEEECHKWIASDTVLLILEKTRCDKICEQIANAFANSMERFYDKEEYEKGYMWSTNKHGEPKKYPVAEVTYEVLI